jgi:PD-(D/E)XK endonuclease
MSVLIGDLMAMTERQQWRARDAAWWRGLTKKRCGEMAEAAFLHKASMLGFGVSKPWGDSEPYDLIVDSGSGLWRVQVKSAYRCNKYGGFMICAHGSRRKKSYSPKEIDALVAYIVPEDLWYVLPVKLFRKTKSLRLYPKLGSPSKYNLYREAWRRLGRKP